MTDIDCRFKSKTEPRYLPRRHDDDCEGDGCRGCLPCTEPHCRVCGKEHVDGTCPGCVGETRDNLTEIAGLCRNLHAEVIHRGIDSEAMSLVGPTADPEAWGHLTTSLKVGRLPAGYLVCDRCPAAYPCEKHADDDHHPLFVLAGWERVWRDALDHDEPTETVTIATASAYLNTQLTYMAGYEHAPFEDFARDLRRCLTHLESVLHAGEQRETGASCMRCEIPQVKVYAGRELPWSEKDHPKLATEDGWVCPKCRSFSTEDRYRLSVKHVHRERAEWLTDADMEIRTNIKAGTVRSWGRDDGPVRRRRDSGRTLYSVEDVETVATEKGMMSA